MSAAKRKSYPTGVSNILKAVLANKNLDKKIEDCKVFEIWDDVVGEKLAGRTEPVLLQKDVLKVAVSDHGWMQQLQFMKEEIKERLNDRLGRPVVGQLFFQIGEIHEKEVKAPPIAEELKKINLTSKEEKDVEKRLKGLVDGEVKEALRHVMEQDIKRKKFEGGT